MQILLAPAKLMIDSAAECAIAEQHVPMFQSDADKIAACMCDYNVSELTAMLHINKDLAISTHKRYNDFFDAATRRVALGRYDGIVFKTIDAETLTPEQLDFANSHVNICSFLYGLLRPLDAINPYRLEGDVTLAALGGVTMFDYWKGRLTDVLIERTMSDDGILVNLASNEMQKLFDWKRIRKELTVISPTFKVETGDRIKTVTIYAKMCRGAMTRFIITNRLTDPELLQEFNYQGFTYSGGGTDAPLFVLHA